MGAHVKQQFVGVFQLDDSAQIESLKFLVNVVDERIVQFANADSDDAVIVGITIKSNLRLGTRDNFPVVINFLPSGLEDELDVSIELKILGNPVDDTADMIVVPPAVVVQSNGHSSDYGPRQGQRLSSRKIIALDENNSGRDHQCPCS